eukprot:ANDGO_07767.mRNA.1 hypothetical protein
MTKLPKPRTAVKPETSIQTSLSQFTHVSPMLSNAQAFASHGNDPLTTKPTQPVGASASLSSSAGEVFQFVPGRSPLVRLSDRQTSAVEEWVAETRRVADDALPVHGSAIELQSGNEKEEDPDSFSSDCSGSTLSAFYRAIYGSHNPEKQAVSEAPPSATVATDCIPKTRQSGSPRARLLDDDDDMDNGFDKSIVAGGHVHPSKQLGGKPSLDTSKAEHVSHQNDPVVVDETVQASAVSVKAPPKKRGPYAKRTTKRAVVLGGDSILTGHVAPVPETDAAVVGPPSKKRNTHLSKHAGSIDVYQSPDKADIAERQERVNPNPATRDACCGEQHPPVADAATQTSLEMQFADASADATAEGELIATSVPLQADEVAIATLAGPLKVYLRALLAMIDAHPLV